MSDKKYEIAHAERNQLKAEDLDFIARWLRTMNDITSENIRGKVNGISINFTGKFIAIDANGFISVQKVER